MKVSLSQTFLLDCAHTLVRAVPLVEFEPSARVHGHTYTMTITVRGDLGAEGMISFRHPRHRKPVNLDVFVLRQAIEKVRVELDHRLLNDVVGLKWPTMEGLCVFVGEHVTRSGLPVSSVGASRATGDSCSVDFN